MKCRNCGEEIFFCEDCGEYEHIGNRYYCPGSAWTCAEPERLDEKVVE